ncbi:hypothetical protein HDU93_009027 [Gonapodya sp. JEL0774]|nr:hypothetical protein HDU93_009027 [Gonapodya sp. JEL0774]
MTAVVSTNPFALLNDDDEGVEVIVPRKAPVKAAPAPAPAAVATKADTRTERAPREDRPRRGGYGRGGAAGGEGRDRNVPPRLARQENGDSREGAPPSDEGRQNSRGGYRGRGRGFPRGERGAYRGRGRQFDRHSATDRVDSEKQEQTGGWGPAGAEAENAPLDSPLDVAPAESKTDEVTAAAAEEPKADVPKTAEQLAAEEERRKEEEERRKEEEMLAKQKTLEQYLAEREAQRVVLENSATEARNLNQGVDPNLLKSDKKFERKPEADIFFVGKASVIRFTKSSAPKAQEVKGKDQKQVVDIDFRFVEEPRRGRGRGGDRPASSGRGGRGGQGGRGRSGAAVNVTDPSAFPSLKPHSAAPFEVQPALRSQVAEWIKGARSFFAVEGRENASAPSETGIDGKQTGRGSNNIMNQDMHIFGSFVASPRVFALEWSFEAFENNLETSVVHLAVQLIANLGHWSDAVRLQCVLQLFKLAQVFSTGDAGAGNWTWTIGSVTAAFQVDDRGLQDATHMLFENIGRHISDMAVSLVAALECFYPHPDQNVRSVCVTALTEIIFHNQKQFVEADQLAAVWNLYFSLNGIDGAGFRQVVDRTVNVKALGLLSPLYCNNDFVLTWNIVRELLKLNNKTDRETSRIKESLSMIFSTLAVVKPPKKPTAKKHSTSSPSPSAEGPLGPHNGGDTNNLYQLFVALLTPHEEQAYDLLPWAVAAYTTSLIPVDKRTTTITPTTNPDLVAMLSSFVQALSNHFRAAPALVRYGACVCLHTVACLWPGLIKHSDLADWLWGIIVTGVLDTDCSTSFLYFEILEGLIRDEMHDAGLLDVLKKARRDERDISNYDAQFGVKIDARISDSKLASAYMRRSSAPPSERLIDALELVLKAIPRTASANLPSAGDAPYSKWVHRLAGSLDYVPAPQKLRILDLIKVWGAGATKV